MFLIHLFFAIVGLSFVMVKAFHCLSSLAEEIVFSCPATDRPARRRRQIEMLEMVVLSIAFVAVIIFTYTTLVLLAQRIMALA